MTVADFAQGIFQLAVEVPFTVTSWGRTWKRNQAVGGGVNSYHLQFLAVDVVADDPTATTFARLVRHARRLGLEVLNEQDHWHIEPDP